MRQYQTNEWAKYPACEEGGQNPGPVMPSDIKCHGFGADGARNQSDQRQRAKKPYVPGIHKDVLYSLKHFTYANDGKSAGALSLKSYFSLYGIKRVSSNRRSLILSMRNSVGKYRSEYLMISQQWRNIHTFSSSRRPAC